MMAATWHPGMQAFVSLANGKKFAGVLVIEDDESWVVAAPSTVQLGEVTMVRVGNEDMAVHFLKVKTKCLRSTASASEVPLRFDRRPGLRQLMIAYKNDATESEAEVPQ